MLHIILTISQLALRGGGKLESLICESPFSCNFKFSAISCQPSAKTKSFNFSNFVSLLAKTQRNAKVVPALQCSPIIFSDSKSILAKTQRSADVVPALQCSPIIFSDSKSILAKTQRNAKVVSAIFFRPYSKLKANRSKRNPYRNHCNEYIMNFNNLIIN